MWQAGGWCINMAANVAICLRAGMSNNLSKLFDFLVHTVLYIVVCTGWLAAY